MRSYLSFVQTRRSRSRLPLGVGLVIALMVSLALWGAAIWGVLRFLKIA
jgi:hypothetical protein